MQVLRREVFVNYKLLPKGAVLNIKCLIKQSLNIAVFTMKTWFINPNLYLLASRLVFFYLPN